ncbi:MAG TPA: PSD1 and planctomycete cytochrome C domain-containing protein [Verrucomicrobiae bacterium]
MRFVNKYAVMLGTWAVLTVSAQAAAPIDGLELFEKSIRPALVDNCYECHSVQGGKAKGGLLLDSKDGWVKGGDNGPAILPGKPDASPLIKAIRYHDESTQMPPKKGPMSDATIKAFEQWVKLGAPDPRVATAGAAHIGPFNFTEEREFWSYQPVKNPAPPKVKNSRWVQSPIDNFILAKLEEKGLTPAKSADKRTLIRRATFDLTGLPPTPEEVDAFLNDKSSKAFERVIERLLASPAYGERWGRHWLDVVRYADTAGCNSDFPVPPAYKYRNWVIDAVNADKPYQQFLREQIAGDLLPAKSAQEHERNIIATGYLGMSRRFASQTNEFYLTLDDSIDNLGKGLMGLTLSCARCHDHKYDAVTAEDYYALYGILKSSTYTFPGVEVIPNPRDYIPLGTDAQKAEWKTYENKLTELDVELTRLDAMVRGANAQKNDVPAIRTKMNEIRKERDNLKANPPKVELAYGVQEGQSADTKLMIKGEPHRLGAVVPRGFLQVLGGQKLPKEEKGSGRKELAEWIIDPANPLTHRVMANRIWHWHFGKGLAQTPNDFGKRGKAPTHPELLDYLTTRFIESGWSLKAMHRLIMLSSTYQMGSEDDAADAAKDIANDYLWRFDRRRLSAEEIRDTLLVLGDSLDLTPGGEHPFPPRNKWSYTQHTPFVDTYPTTKRSVYMMQQRIRKHPFFETWDGADPNSSTGARPLSITPIQALFQMNDPLIHEQADKFAQRVWNSAKKDADRIQNAFVFAYGRPATKDEIKTGEEYLGAISLALKESGTPVEKMLDAAWASYVRVLFSSNEFIFVD